MIILDLGNGDAHHNDKVCILETFESIADIVSKRKDVVLKFQLFQSFGDKKNTRWDIWDWAYDYGRQLGFDVTASVFDYDSWDFLVKNYRIPFLKVANKDYLRKMIPPGPHKLFSVDSKELFYGYAYLSTHVMACISNYPADMKEYEAEFRKDQLSFGISDHTGELELYAKYKPLIYEAHYILHKWDDKGRKYCLNSKDLIELMSLRREQ